jgi:3-oxoacyl-[acyl-carrier protein] reductase
MDRYQQFVESPPGRLVARRLGLPQPTPLRRHEPEQPLLTGPLLLGGGGRLAEPVRRVLKDAGVEVHDRADDREWAALVFDASGIERSEDLRAAYDFFHPVIRQVGPSGRVLVLGTPPEAASPRARVAQRALEGFVRSAGKEVRRGATAQLLYVAPEAEGLMESTLRFLLSARSAYVSGQVVRVGPAVPDGPASWGRPLDGNVAVVTGASRGIGAAIAGVLARDGAHVVCLDVPSQGADLTAVANRCGGSAVQLDITAERSPAALAEHLRERHGGVDVVVHNAGITRDRTLARMSEDEWASVLAVNLTAIERLNDALLDVLNRGGRIVCVSSVSGIAGNRGQANYATSKAGVIGVVEALAPSLPERQATINAVAPGFIETRMTAAMPVATREAGRRMNSLAQGGLPVDVAETVAWFASPASGGVNGNVVRVCGQSLIGA